MTDTQKNALKIVIEAVVSGASNGYMVKVDDIVTVIEGIIEKEKETQFIPGIYPSITDPNKPYPLKTYPGTGNPIPILWDQTADQIVYTHNSTDVDPSDIQMICEKNTTNPIEWEDNF